MYQLSPVSVKFKDVLKGVLMKISLFKTERYEDSSLREFLSGLFCKRPGYQEILLDATM